MLLLFGMRRIEMVGRRFGRLTVLRQAENHKDRVRWLCLCDCGKEHISYGTLMRSGHSKSCGCLDVDLKRERATSHGLSKHPLHAIWKGILTRCDNPNREQWSDYGGRGITICDEWRDFVRFYEDMHADWRPGLSIERRNNDLGYGPKNCVWATRHEQAANSRNCVWVDTPRGKMIVADAARLSGLSAGTIRQRHFAGWPSERMFERNSRGFNGKNCSSGRRLPIKEHN